MDHLDDGTLQGYMDGELATPTVNGVERHLQDCGECREALAELAKVGHAVSGALRTLDPQVDLEAARWSHRVRRADRRRGGSPQRSWLAAAAVAVLFLSAGVASALPGSPVRGWLESRSGEGEIVAPSTLATDIESTGVFTSPRNGEVEVDVLGLGPSEWIEVVAVAGNRAGAFAAPGAAFESGAGRIRVVAHPGTGGVRIEIPSSVRSAVVRYEGRPILHRTDSGFMVSDGASVEGSGTSVRVRPRNGEWE